MNRFKIAIVYLVLFSSSLVGIAQNINRNSNMNFGDKLLRNLFISEELSAYKKNASILGEWEHPEFAHLQFEGDFEKGTLKTIDDFHNIQSLNIYTESIQRIEEGGWTFYGKLQYTSSAFDSAAYNLTFEKSTIGSPFFMVMERSGDWRNKAYTLSGGLNKKINEKFNIGLSVNYHGGIQARIRDTRNQQRHLNMLVSAGLAYRINSNRSLGIDLAIRNKKAKPELNNSFIHSGDDLNPRLLTGLGDFNKFTFENQIFILDRSPEFTLSYLSKGEKTVRLQLNSIPGVERWDRKITSLEAQKSIDYLKYNYYKNTLDVSMLFKKTAKTFLAKANIYSLFGNGYEYRNEAYQKTYIYNNIGTTLSGDLINPVKQLFYKNRFKLNVDYSRKKDMIYAQSMSFLNANLQLQTGYRYDINASNKLCFNLKPGLKWNLFYTHDPVAASKKPYTLNIGYDYVAYTSANIVNTGADITWNADYKDIDIEIIVDYKYCLPIDIKLQNQYTPLNQSTNRQHVNLAARFYF